jgi:hypothetical protein
VVSPFLTTPSALSKVASGYFLDAQPPSGPRRKLICSEDQQPSKGTERRPLLEIRNSGFHQIADEDCGTVLVSRVEENEYGHKISMQMPVLQKLPVRTGGMFLQVRRQPSQVQLHMQVLQVTIGRAQY